jgi:hypothetical protein
MLCPQFHNTTSFKLRVTRRENILTDKHLPFNSGSQLIYAAAAIIREMRAPDQKLKTRCQGHRFKIEDVILMPGRVRWRTS